MNAVDSSFASLAMYHVADRSVTANVWNLPPVPQAGDGHGAPTTLGVERFACRCAFDWSRLLGAIRLVAELRVVRIHRILVCFAVLVCVPVTAAHAECVTGTMDVAADKLRVRSQPVDGKIISKLRRGEVVKVIACRDTWGLLERSSAKHPEQWVHSDYLAWPKTNKLDARLNIEVFCARKWHDNFDLQVFCVKKQSEAYRSVGGLQGYFDEGSEEQNIIESCVNKWSDPIDGTNWQMAEHCSQKEVAAYRASN